MLAAEQECCVHKWESFDVSSHNLLPEFGGNRATESPLEVHVSFKQTDNVALQGSVTTLGMDT